MRRIALLVLAAVVAACFATPAFAAIPAYEDWTAGPPNDTSLDTPHKDYQVTTNKCGVCHAIHQAGWYDTADGTINGSQTAGEKVPGEDSEMLLRGNVANACQYCHIDSAIGGKVIYNGIASNYTTANVYGHQAAGGALCVQCHSVHGAGTLNGTLSAKILKVRPFQQEFVDDLAGGDPNVLIEASYTVTPWPYLPAEDWDARAVQTTAFCTECHPYYARASEQVLSATAYVEPLGTTDTIFYNSHPMKFYGGENGNPMGVGFEAQGHTINPSSTVAWMTTRGCAWNCHSAGSRDAAPGVILDSFPHYTPDNARFLTDNVGPVHNPSQDSVCLVCHYQPFNGTDPTRGVGVSY